MINYLYWCFNLPPQRWGLKGNSLLAKVLYVILFIVGGCSTFSLPQCNVLIGRLLSHR